MAKDLKIGDLIQIRRFCYEHWVVYIGDGKVIHVVKISVCLRRRAQIREGKLVDVAGRSKCRVNNLENCLPSRGLQPREGDVVVQAARERLGQIIPYRLLKRNCELFATECRFGKGFSGQTAATIKSTRKWLWPFTSIGLCRNCADNLSTNPLDKV